MSIWNWLLSKLVKEPATKSPEDDKNEGVSENEEKTVSTEAESEVFKKPEVKAPKAKVRVSKEAKPKVVKEKELVAPTEAELLEGYKKAMKLKKDGKVLAAEKILIHSCEPPSVYKTHYKELFKIWRQYNRDDLKAKKYRKVLDRVLKMRKLDDEMIAEMLRYWGTEQGKDLSKDYFDADRNLLVSDAKALKIAAEALQENKNVELADSIMEKFSKK